jgi:CRISPR-associated protein (TIGR02710 family)
MIEKDVLLISIGSSVPQTIFSLKANCPKYVIFVVSNATYNYVEQIKKESGLEFTATEQIHIENNENDITACYKKIVREVPPILGRWRKSYENVVIDYTGGTKVMSVAIVLATIESCSQYCYISGHKREGPGMRVVSGSEQPVFRQNPWEELCVRDLNKIDLMFSRARYKTSVEIMNDIIQKVNVEKREIFKAIKDILEGYAHWDDFRHNKAIDSFTRGVNNLRRYKLINEKDIGRIIGLVENHLKIIKKAIDGPKKNPTFLIKDIISNAWRRMKLEEKYDDAVARLYSAIERVAKFRLLEHYGIDNSSARGEQIPESIRPSFQNCLDKETGTYRFGLQKSFELLCALGDEIGKEYGKCFSKIKKIMDMRNQSILAHGNDPVSRDLCYQMFEFVIKFAGLNEDDLFIFPDLNLKKLIL